MFGAAQELSGIWSPIIDRTLAEARQDPQAFCETEESALVSGSLKGLLGQQSERLQARSSDEARQWKTGYLVGHHVLQAAAIETDRTLPSFTGSILINYAALIERYPERLQIDLVRDYREVGHTPVMELVEGFRFPANYRGAATMFTIHGNWANPERGQIEIPCPVTAAAKPRRMQQQLQLSKTRHRRI